MKIVVIGTRGFPNIRGKVESHCENLYPRLAAKGCEVVVFTRQPYVIEPQKEYRGVSLVPIDCPTNPYFEALVHTLKGIFAARKLKPDLVHFHGIGPALCLPLARIFGIKAVMTHHGQDYQSMKWGRIARMFLRAGEFLGCKFANEVIAVSGLDRRGYPQAFRQDGSGHSLWRYGAAGFPGRNDFDAFCPGRTKVYSLRRQICPGKGVPSCDRCLCEVSSLRTPLPSIRSGSLVIVGWAEHDTPYSQALTKKAKGEQECGPGGVSFRRASLGNYMPTPGLFYPSFLL